MCRFNFDVSVIKDREASFVKGDAFVSSRLSCRTRFLQCTGTQIFQSKHLENNYGFELIPKYIRFYMPLVYFNLNSLLISVRHPLTRDWPRAGDVAWTTTSRSWPIYQDQLGQPWLLRVSVQKEIRFTDLEQAVWLPVCHALWPKGMS